jgi:hypothetical protein
MTKWLSTAVASQLSGRTPRVLRALAARGKLKWRRGKDPEWHRCWYLDPKIDDLRKSFLTNPKRDFSMMVNYLGGCSRLDAARVLGCREKTVDHLLATGRINEFSGGGIPEWGIATLGRTLRKLAEEGKLNPEAIANARRLYNAGGRKLWFRTVDIVRLKRQAVPSQREAKSTLLALASRLPGEFLTQADAAKILAMSIQGVRYLRKTKQLWSKKLGATTIVVKRSEVLRLAKKKNRKLSQKMLDRMLEGWSPESFGQTGISMSLERALRLSSRSGSSV